MAGQPETAAGSVCTTEKESLISPPVEKTTLLWVFLLGIPGLLLFLVLQKASGL